MWMRRSLFCPLPSQFFCKAFGQVKIFAYLWRAISANLSGCIVSMAKIRVSTNPLYKGGAGGYSFYVRGGEQVVRQRRNNSNYGETASRTYPQMVRRVKWSNLVNMYKIMKTWMPKAFENKSQGQTDYNIFMSLNANSVSAAITKDMSLADNCIVEAVQVSRGTLPPLALVADSVSAIYKTNIKLTQDITSATTVGQLATDILANNGDFVANDNLAVIKFDNYIDPRVEWPIAHSYYAEITLNTADTRTLASIPGIAGIFDKSADNFLTIEANRSNEVGCVAIHTRKQSASLSVSSQNIVMLTDEYIMQYSGEEWINTCIQTYGLDQEVPLDPNFRGGIITQVTANDVVIGNAASLTGSQTIKVYGNQLYGNGYSFIHNGIEYTPLSSTDDYDEYILTDNGSYIINIGGQRFMSFSVQGVVVPDGFPTRISAGIVVDNWSSSVQSKQIDGLCLNYGVKKAAGDLGYAIALGTASAPFTDGDSDNYEFENCELHNAIAVGSDYVIMKVTVTDFDNPAYISYKGLVFAVFNYTA